MYPSKKHKTFGIFIYNQVEQLRNNGLNIDVLANSDPLTKKMILFKKYIIWFLKGIFFLIVGRKYNVVHVHYVFPSGLIGLMFKKIWKQKLVVTVHGSDLYKMAKKTPVLKKWTKTILANADHVITVGQELFEEVTTEYQVDSYKVSSLSMGVNREIFKPVQNVEKIKAQLQLDNRLKTILYVGNITSEKGLLELLEAYSSIKKRFSHYSLHLIGSQKDEDFVKQLKSLVSDRHIKDVFLHHAIPQDEVSKWMSIADVFVLPSYHEGFGLVALEAMACGTPVIGSGVGGLKYLLNEGAGMIIDPNDIKALSEGIIKVVSDDVLRNQMVLNSQKKVEEHDQQKIIGEIIKVYQA